MITKLFYIFMIGILIGVGIITSLAILKSNVDKNSQSDNIQNAYLIDKCPSGYFPHTYSAGDKWCLKMIGK